MDGNYSLKGVSFRLHSTVQAKWGVRRGTLSARATRENWNDLKQQFAVKVEQIRREKSLAKRAAEQMQFEDAISAAARIQVGMILRQSRAEGADVAKLLKLANALETLQRIGSTAFAGTGAAGAGPDARGIADDRPAP